MTLKIEFEDGSSILVETDTDRSLRGQSEIDVPTGSFGDAVRSGLSRGADVATNISVAQIETGLSCVAKLARKLIAACREEAKSSPDMSDVNLSGKIEMSMSISADGSVKIMSGKAASSIRISIDWN